MRGKIDKKFLRVQITTTIANDAEPKSSREQYPGYWLMRAREMLNPGTYAHMIKDTRISDFDAHTYIFLFKRYAFEGLAKKQDEPPFHPNCKCE